MPHRKRLLLQHSELNTGGAEMSMLRMLKALADRGWQITLVLTAGGGTLEAAIDPRVHLYRLRPHAAGERFVAARGMMERVAALPDLLDYLVMRLVGAARMLPFLFRRYDAAAMGLMGKSSWFLRRIVRADTRAIWIRNDLGHVDPTGRVAERLRAARTGIDWYVCVSGTARDALVAAVPDLADKSVVIYNLLAPDEMRGRADAAAPEEMMAAAAEGLGLILTVCRLQERSKGLLRMVRVAARLRDEGVEFRWFVAGDGPDRTIMEQAIAEAGLGEHMILLGRLGNPFPAYRTADVVAMLSNYEGLCGVVNEARVMERPVVATRVSGIDEQLTDGVNGLVVDQDEDAIVAALSRVLTDEALRARLAGGGYPTVLLDDETKLDRLETILLGQGAIT